MGYKKSSSCQRKARSDVSCVGSEFLVEDCWEGFRLRSLGTVSVGSTNTGCTGKGAGQRAPISDCVLTEVSCILGVVGYGSYRPIVAQTEDFEGLFGFLLFASLLPISLKELLQIVCASPLLRTAGTST